MRRGSMALSEKARQFRRYERKKGTSEAEIYKLMVEKGYIDSRFGPTKAESGKAKRENRVLKSHVTSCETPSPQIPETQGVNPSKDITEQELMNKLELMEKVGQKEFTEEKLLALFYEALNNIDDNEQRLKLISIGTTFLDKKKALKEARQESLDLDEKELKKLLGD